jgi:hypothetical protein
MVEFHMRPWLLYGKNPRKSNAKKQKAGYRADATVKYRRAYAQLFGSQGAASPVRKIDPVTGEVIACHTGGEAKEFIQVG